VTVSVYEAARREAASWLIPEQEYLESDPARVPVCSLLVAEFSPRTHGENSEHVEILTEAQSELPPIIVHRPTMGVIDGAHRVLAAKRRGETHIDAYFFNGSEADAFVIAVKANVGHGLPLSLGERKAAAERIVASHPQWSDRMNASFTGISSGTVAHIRKSSGDESSQVMARIGHDGRVRPVNAAERRMLASQLITDNPGLSLRQVARAVGISPETVRDVRNRLKLGDDPVPQRNGTPQNGSSDDPARGQREPGAAPRASALPNRDVAAIIERLRNDPTLRFSEVGRTLVRLLHLHFVETQEWAKIGETVPLHCSGIIVGLARDYAELWKEFAERVEGKGAQDL
jgi:hypothetical protein